MVYFGIFYKDKDGFDLLMQDENQMMVYPSKNSAKSALSKHLEKIENILNPKIIYKNEGSFFKKKMVKITPPQLSEWVRNELIQKKNTAFLKAINIV